MKHVLSSFPITPSELAVLAAALLFAVIAPTAHAADAAPARPAPVTPGLTKDREVTMKKIGADDGLGESAEIRGVQAGPFDPVLWKAGTLHWVPNDPAPIIEPLKTGSYRNTYAPSIVREKDGWRVFYGGWDGTRSWHDHVYSRVTADFRTFTDRRFLVRSGQFRHVNNCSAVKLPDGTYYMMATCRLESPPLNKPGCFRSPDAVTWNGKAPYAAREADLIKLDGYEGFAGADINGMNVMLHEDGVFRLYFCNFRERGSVWRASSKDGASYRLDGVALKAGAVVNDVKKFAAGGRTSYLMALHMNGNKLWYSLSADGMKFAPMKKLTDNQGAFDRYMVAVGWVCDDTAVYGYLYGAGAVQSLNQNRIFAKWLQKRVEFVSGGKVAGRCTAASGPDRARMKLPAGGLTGRFRVFAEDGRSRLCESGEVTVRPGEVWELAPRPVADQRPAL